MKDLKSKVLHYLFTYARGGHTAKAFADIAAQVTTAASWSSSDVASALHALQMEERITGVQTDKLRWYLTAAQQAGASEEPVMSKGQLEEIKKKTLAHLLASRNPNYLDINDICAILTQDGFYASIEYVREALNQLDREGVVYTGRAPDREPLYSAFSSFDPPLPATPAAVDNRADDLRAKILVTLESWGPHTFDDMYERLQGYLAGADSKDRLKEILHRLVVEGEVSPHGSPTQWPVYCLFGQQAYLVTAQPDIAQLSRFEEIAAAIGAVVTKKNAAYGDSFAKTDRFLELLYPNGIAVEQFSDALALTRVFDKMMRIATDKYAYDENPWEDIGGYAVLALKNADTKARFAKDPKENKEPQKDA